MLAFIGQVGWVLSRVRDAGASVLGCYQYHAPNYVRFFVINGVLLLISLLGPPGVALGASVLALGLLVCVYAAWGENEARRGRIAKKVMDMPSPPPAELSWLALWSMAMTLLHLPPWLRACQGCFQAFKLEGEGEPFILLWGRFLLDKTYLRALPDSVDLWIMRVTDIHNKSIDYHDVGLPRYVGIGLVMVAWGLVAVTIVQGIARWWQVRRDFQEGTEGVRKDPDMAVRLGRRAVPGLLTLWHDATLQYHGKPESPENEVAARARRNIAQALGEIGDVRGLDLLKAGIKDRRADVQRASLQALGRLANSPEMAEHRTEVINLLAEALNKGASEDARRGAAAGLGEIDDPMAAGPLLRKLEQVYRLEPGIGQEGSRYTEVPNVRKDVVHAVGKHMSRRRKKAEPDAKLADDMKRAVDHILANDETPSLLEDVYLRVRNASARALAQLGNARAVPALIDRLQDPMFQNPQLVTDTVTALGTLVKDLLLRGEADPEAGVRELMKILRESANESVRRAAVTALTDTLVALPNPSPLADEALERLVEEHRDALIDGQWELGKLIYDETTKTVRVRPGASESPTKARLKHDRDLHGLQASQERRAALLRAGDRNDRQVVEKRQEAAQKIAEAHDARGLAALHRVLSRDWEDQGLRETCEKAVDDIMRSLRSLAADRTLPDRRRTRAAYELGRFGRQEGRRVLETIRDEREESPELRKAARDALVSLAKRLGLA